MFDIGWSEMAIIMLLALIIIGPKDLPRVARTIGQWVRKGRMLAREFQTSLEDMAKEAELDDVKNEIEKIGKTDLKKTVESAVDPKGDLKKAFDTSDGASGEETVGKTLNGSGGTKTPSTGQTDATPPAAKTETASPATTSPSKPAASSKKPASKPKSAAAKPKAARTTSAKKPAAPKKRAAKPASTAKSGKSDAPSSADDGGAAVAAKPS